MIDSIAGRETQEAPDVAKIKYLQTSPNEKERRRKTQIGGLWSEVRAEQ